MPIFIILLAFFLGTAAPAWATVLTAEGGLALGRNSGLNDIKLPSPVAGIDYTLDGSSHFDLGGFFNHDWAVFNPGDSGSINFMGLLVRYHLNARESGDSGGSGFYGIARLGVSQVSSGNNCTTSRLGYGGGIGYSIPISQKVSISPQAEGRMLQNSASQTTDQALVAASLALSIHF